jgi:Protein of unknown function (DUF2975)
MPLRTSVHRRLTHTDWLRELHGLLVVGMALSVVGLIAVVAMAILGPLSASVPADHTVTTSALHGLTGGARLDQHGTIGVAIADPTPYQVILGALAVVPTGIVVLMMLAALYRVVRDARRGDPFTEATVRRLRRLSAVVIIGGPLAWTVEFCAQFALTGTLTQAGAGATMTFTKPLTWLLVGFGYLAVAEIINRGRSMRTELDQVI